MSGGARGAVERVTRRRDRSALWRWAAAAALLLQTALLYWPSQAGPDTDLPVDKVGHFLMFAGVAGLAVLGGIPAAWIVAALLGQAALSETVQLLVLAERGGDWWDLAADVVGIAAGLMAGLVAGRWLVVRRPAGQNLPVAAMPAAGSPAPDAPDAPDSPTTAETCPDGTG